MTASSAIEFLIWLLIAASIIAIVAGRLRIPYTAALVLGGVVLSLVPPHFLSSVGLDHRPHWLTPQVILTLFLPALVFEGSVKLNLYDLLRAWAPLLILANLGVLFATLVTGYLVYWAIGLPLLVALLFGAIISATDPISVLALFRNWRTDHRLSALIESESLFNDGTAVVLFQILLAVIVSDHFNVLHGIGDFLVEVLGGAAIGIVFGYLASRITARIDDPQVEITLTTIVAYGSYLLAYRSHLSGIIATACAGLVVGNVGKNGMAPQTRVAMQAFWEYVAFVMNSLVFLLIGLEVHISVLVRSWRPVLLAIAAVLIGRAVSVYILVPVCNTFAEKIPPSWQHAIFWGGLRGALALALALSLDPQFPDRQQVLDLTFGVVIFSILVQALTLEPLLRRLGLVNGNGLAKS
jgi:CPA1 family monovalent cation:H+ antiporter